MRSFVTDGNESSLKKIHHKNLLTFFLNKMLSKLLFFFLFIKIKANTTSGSSIVLNSLQQDPSFPLWPFGRQLQLGDTGRDVLVLNRLLAARALEWCFANPPISSSIFDMVTKSCLSLFQDAKVKGFTQRGIFDAITAFTILEQLGKDSYVDSGIPPFELGYLYKVLVKLPSTNRSVEATAYLIASNGTELFNFTVRLHGAENYPVPDWPSYNNTDSGLSEFASDGATPTGLAEFDLNSPESNTSEFGPFPINRAVRGLEGNWAILSTNDNTNYEMEYYFTQENGLIGHHQCQCQIH